MARLQSLVEEEAVQHLDDLIFRRTSLWNIPQKAVEIALQTCDFFDWDYHRQLGELERLKDALPLLENSGKARDRTREIPSLDKAINATELEVS
jgi:hypothetical protein